MDKPPAQEYKGHPRFYKILDEMRNLHDKKNSDYSQIGDPLSNLRSSEEFFAIPAPFGIAIRMSDKWSRFCRILRKMQDGEALGVVSESIIDTLKDFAVYCILEIIVIEEWLDKKTKVG